MLYCQGTIARESLYMVIVNAMFDLQTVEAMDVELAHMEDWVYSLQNYSEGNDLTGLEAQYYNPGYVREQGRRIASSRAVWAN